MAKHYYTEKQYKELLSHLVILHTGNEQVNDHIVDYFDKNKIKHKKKALKTGDYSFYIETCPELGFIRDTYFTDQLAIERKNSVDELAGNFVEHNERFFKELNRFINIQDCYILLEDDKIDDVIEHNYRSKYDEKAYLRRLLAVQKVSNFYLYFIKKENMGKMIYEICLSSLNSKILK